MRWNEDRAVASTQFGSRLWCYNTKLQRRVNQLSLAVLGKAGDKFKSMYLVVIRVNGLEWSTLPPKRESPWAGKFRL